MEIPEKFEAGTRQSAIFANEIITANGDAVVKSLTLQRRHKDKNEKWKSLNSHRPLQSF